MVIIKGIEVHHAPINHNVKIEVSESVHCENYL